MISGCLILVLSQCIALHHTPHSPLRQWLVWNSKTSRHCAANLSCCRLRIGFLPDIFQIYTQITQHLVQCHAQYSRSLQSQFKLFASRTLTIERSCLSTCWRLRSSLVNFLVTENWVPSNMHSREYNYSTHLRMHGSCFSSSADVRPLEGSS